MKFFERYKDAHYSIPERRRFVPSGVGVATFGVCAVILGAVGLGGAGASGAAAVAAGVATTVAIFVLGSRGR